MPGLRRRNGWLCDAGCCNGRLCNGWLCNIALALHTPMPETSPLGPRFICTAATLRGSRVLIGDSFVA